MAGDERHEIHLAHGLKWMWCIIFCPSAQKGRHEPENMHLLFPDPAKSAGLRKMKCMKSGSCRPFLRFSQNVPHEIQQASGTNRAFSF